MFTRNSPAEPKPLAPTTTRSGTNGVDQHAPATESTEKSVIGNDLKIIGQGLKIIGRGVLQVDGEIEGDVQGAEVIVGERGKVTGMVAARQVIIRGTVSGVICGKTVALQGTSRVEGDIHHLTIGIELGALFEGRSRRVGSDAELNSVVDGKAAAEPLRR